MKKQLLIGAMLMGAFFTAQAQVSYSFEQLEGFEVGPLLIDEQTGEGQNGWLAFNPFAEIISTDATEGSNSLYIGTSNELQEDFGFAVSPEFTNVTGDITFSYDVKISEFAEGGSTFHIALESAAEEMVTSRILFLPDGTCVYVNEDEVGDPQYYYLGTVIDEDTFEPFVAEANTWYNIRIEHNFTEGNIEFYVDDVLLGASVVWAAASADIAIFGSDNGSSTVTIDNVEINGDTAGINENLAASLSVFPNPATDVIKVANAENILVNGIVVTDLNGRTVKTAKFNGVAEAQINVSDLASGIYMMTISSDKGTTTKKIVKN